MPPAKQPTLNSDLKAVHTDLIAVFAALDEAVGKAKTAAEVNKMLDQLDEVNSRVTAVGRQLFAEQTNAIRTAAKTVTDATEKTKKAIAELDKVKDILAGVTKFLGLVDKVIKLVAPIV